MSLPRLSRQSIGFPLARQWFLRVLGVDFQEVVQDDHQHGGAAEEDGEGVEGGVGDHGDGVDQTFLSVMEGRLLRRAEDDGLVHVP